MNNEIAPKVPERKSPIRRLSELNLSPEVFQQVLSIIADIEEANEQRRESNRQRTARWRESQRHKRNVTVTPHKNSSTKSTNTLRHSDSHHPFTSSSSLSSSVASSLSDSQESKEVVVDGRELCIWPENYRELFWEKYPNKVGKPKALEKLDRVRLRGVAWAELWGGLERYVAKTDDRPWCNPETWINQERWTDQPAARVNGHGHTNRKDRRAEEWDVIRAELKQSIDEDRARQEGDRPALRLLPTAAGK